MKLPTNREVWENGEVLDDWACDLDVETGEASSNGAVEYKMLYNGKVYFVATDWDGEKLYKPHRKAHPVEEE
jgi:hypothetical protein